MRYHGDRGNDVNILDSITERLPLIITLYAKFDKQRRPSTGVQLAVLNSTLNIRDLSSIAPTPPQDPNSCIATYNTNGSLNLPCVVVPDAFGNKTLYQVGMQLAQLANSIEFNIIDVQQIERTLVTNECASIYQSDGSLTIPCVMVPDETGGTIMYQADMQFIPLSNPISFKLTDAQQKNR